MTDDDRLLVEILGATDAVWAPLRKLDWGSDHASQNTYAAQQAFPSQGVPWQSTERREADRKSQYRRLERLAVAEWLDILPTRKKAPGCRLTPRGEWRARSLASLPSLADAHLAASVLADIQATYTESVWINECIILGGARGNYDDRTLGKHHSARLWAHQSTFLPVLSREIVATASDVQGRVYYLLGLHDDAIDFVAGVPPEPPCQLPPPDGSDGDVYFLAWRAKREELRHRLPDNPRDIGPCPLPCGVGMVIPVDDWDREPKRRAARRKATAKKTAKPKRKAAKK